ncbi:Hypothetical predicted protein [Olea europaea subsp. europaea]|uniref:Uncharacterized protein n=1 Tax=Olea europaea subsp. europaea TaxID=158383 RepID=A0A8S0T2A7_OLEEU|nr:Hypothetical predicted protein [Olea europaea subsp. europaea]
MKLLVIDGIAVATSSGEATRSIDTSKLLAASIACCCCIRRNVGANLHIDDVVVRFAGGNGGRIDMGIAGAGVAQRQPVAWAVFGGFKEGTSMSNGFFMWWLWYDDAGSGGLDLLKVLVERIWLTLLGVVVVLKR